MRWSPCVALVLSVTTGCGLILDLEPARERSSEDAGRIDDAGGDDDAGADEDAGVAPVDGGGRDGGPADGGMPSTACEDAISDALVLSAGDSVDGLPTCGGPDVADLECFGTSGTPEAHFIVDATGGAVRVTISSKGEFVLGRLDAEDCTSVVDCSETELIIAAGETAHVIVEAPNSGGCGGGFLVSVVGM